MSALTPEDSPEYVAMVDIATCLCAQIEADEIPDVCSCGVQPGGAVALDFGECQGIAWVSPRLGYPTRNFPNPAIDYRSCSARGEVPAIQLEVGISRTLPLSDDGQPLDEAQWLACAAQQMVDLQCIRRALTCCADYDIVLSQWNALDPQGGVYGVAQLVTVLAEKDVYH